MNTQQVKTVVQANHTTENAYYNISYVMAEGSLSVVYVDVMLEYPESPLNIGQMAYENNVMTIRNFPLNENTSKYVQDFYNIVEELKSGTSTGGSDLEEEVTLEAAKKAKIEEIEAYNDSDSVNWFYLNDIGMWLEPDLRVNLERQIKARQQLGQEVAPIALGGTIMDIPCEQGLQMLAELEIYAADAYNATEQHKAAVNALQDVKSVKVYDYKTGYPEIKRFTIN